MDCEKFASLAKTWGGKCCIFGAGLCGSTWGYKMIVDAGFDIECYVDNYKNGTSCNGYPVFSCAYLEKNTGVLCFVAIMGDRGKEIVTQLSNIGIGNYFVLPEKEEFDIEFAQYLDEKKDEVLISRFHELMDDKSYLMNRFRERMGYTPDIDHPRTFNEKLQWLKLYDRKPLYTTLVDKYAVKKYVSDKIGKEHVIPTLGVYDSFDDIDFDKLPKQFVLKCTHDSGSIVICKNRDQFDIDVARCKLETARKKNYFWPDREWPYYNVPRRIIAEEYIESRSNILNVYKIFNFVGKPELIQVIQDDKTTCESIDYYDTKWNLLELRQNYPNSLKHLNKPERLKDMLNIASILSKGFPFVRVDLYVNEGDIFFSEFTFFTDSGSEKFHPDDWDDRLGKLVKLPDLDGIAFRN